MTEEYNSALSMLMSGMATDQKRNQILRIPFGYPGNKYDQLDHIMPHIPYRKKFVEHFGGTGALLLNRLRSEVEVINDRYSGITSLYRVIRDPELKAQFLARAQVAVHSREEFMWAQDTWQDCNDPVERAARWYYCSKFSVNCKPETTFGRVTNSQNTNASSYFSGLDQFYPIHCRLQGVMLENLDWRQSITDFDDEGCVHYCDPTYLGCVGTNYMFELTPAEHMELCQRLMNCSGFVALSGYNNPETCAIYDKFPWKDKIVWGRKSAASVVDSGGMSQVTEALWIK